MLRVIIRRYIELGDQATTLTESMQFLRALSWASIALARLIKTQYLLIPETDPIQEALYNALDEVWAGWDREANSTAPSAPPGQGTPPPEQRDPPVNSRVINTTHSRVMYTTQNECGGG